MFAHWYHEISNIEKILINKLTNKFFNDSKNLKLKFKIDRQIKKQKIYNIDFETIKQNNNIIEKSNIEQFLLKNKNVVVDESNISTKNITFNQFDIQSTTQSTTQFNTQLTTQYNTSIDNSIDKSIRIFVWDDFKINSKNNMNQNNHHERHNSKNKIK